jgi:hypothetical protein
VRFADAVFLAAGGAGKSLLDVAVRLGKVTAHVKGTVYRSPRELGTDTRQSGGAPTDGVEFATHSPPNASPAPVGPPPARKAQPTQALESAGSAFPR